MVLGMTRDLFKILQHVARYAVSLLGAWTRSAHSCILIQAETTKSGAERAAVHIWQRTVDIRLRGEPKGPTLLAAGGVDERDI